MKSFKIFPHTCPQDMASLFLLLKQGCNLDCCITNVANTSTETWTKWRTIFQANIFENVIYKMIARHCRLRYPIGNKSALVLVMAWHQTGEKPSLIARFMGPIWGRQDPGGPHVGPMDFTIWAYLNQCWLRFLTPYGVTRIHNKSQGDWFNIKI